MKMLIVGVIAIFLLENFEQYYFHIRKEQWKETSAYTEAHANPGDLVLFTSGLFKMNFDIYSKRSDLIKGGILSGI